MNTALVTMAFSEVFVAMPASAQPYAGTEAGDSNADSRNAYTPISHVKMLIWL